jgi:hypothetical protein
MPEFLNDNPWLIIPSLALLIPIIGIMFGTVTSYLLRARQAELDAALKQDMLQRGMTAEEIRIVIEASPRRKGRRCSEAQADRSEVA